MPCMENSRFAEYRDRQRGGPPRALKPCGTVAAYRRHQRNGETPCEPCRAAWSEYQRQQYQRRKGMTDTYTLASSDAGKVVQVNAGTAKTVTVPTNASVAFPVGTVVRFADD